MSAAPSAASASGAPINRTLQWTVWAALGLVIAGIVAGYVRQQWRAAEQRAVSALPRYNQVPAFTLTERSGQPLDAASLHGKVWLADFFFTACPGPCLAMNARMESIAQALAREHADVRLVSFTITPAQDTPEVLRRYAERFHAAPDRWFFLTGDQTVIYDLARKTFMLPTVDNRGNPNRAPDDGDYIHSEKISLVDREGFVRRYYDSTNPEMIQQVLGDVGALLREPPGSAASPADTARKPGT